MANKGGFGSVKIFDKENREIFSRVIGESSFGEDCLLLSIAKKENYPLCYSRKDIIFYFENGKKKQGFIEIVTASNNWGSSISVLKGSADRGKDEYTLF